MSITHYDVTLLKIICPFTSLCSSLTLTADLTCSTIFKYTGGRLNEQQWLYTGCESIGHACAGEEGSAESGRGWQASNEVRNVMYDCSKGQVREGDVILLAAALGNEVLSRFLFPCVPESMNHGRCGVTYTLPIYDFELRKMRDFLKLYGSELWRVSDQGGRYEGGIDVWRERCVLLYHL